MYSLICLEASTLILKINDTNCFLDGHYLICLSCDDKLEIIRGYYDVLNLQFLPYFYNVNLNHKLFELPIYQEMRDSYGYPDFNLFICRRNGYLGIIPISEEDYFIVRTEFQQARMHINDHELDYMWSCKTRSNMISILRMAQASDPMIKEQKGMEIIKYISNNLNKNLSVSTLCSEFNTNRTTLNRLIKELTGLTPGNYIHHERLNQSRPDLLFTFVPINEIAKKYGFSDINYYIRSFKKQFGVSPLKYRLEGREKRIREEHIYHKLQNEAESDSTIHTDGAGNGMKNEQLNKIKNPFVYDPEADINQRVLFDF